MKLIKMFFVLAASVFGLSACNSSTSTSSNTDTSTSNTMTMDTMQMDSHKMTDTAMMANGLMTAMDASMGKMQSMQMTGDFDQDFATMMIEHHQGAIDMSKEELAKGTDEKMKAMAQNIISKQSAEQNQFKSILQDFKPSGMKHGEGELPKSMTAMTNKMKSMQMSGNIDKDFATMMIPHHEAAISMFKMELKNGMDSQLKKLAQKGITDQQKEIAEFKAWLSAYH